MGGIVERYDADDSNDIETDEVRTATSDWVAGNIETSQYRSITSEYHDDDGIANQQTPSNDENPDRGVDPAVIAVGVLALASFVWRGAA